MSTRPDGGGADDLPKLSKPARRALERAGIRRLGQLAAMRDSDIAKMHGLGPTGMEQLRQALAAKGLSFGA